MAKRHRDREDRREQHYRRLGTRNPLCVVCSESDPRCLEGHHIAGAKHHRDVIIVCRNCHRKLTDQQFDHVPTTVLRASADLEAIGRYLLGLSDQYAMTAETLQFFGELLLNESKH